MSLGSVLNIRESTGKTEGTLGVFTGLSSHFLGIT